MTPEIRDVAIEMWEEIFQEVLTETPDSEGSPAFDSGREQPDNDEGNTSIVARSRPDWKAVHATETRRKRT